MKTALVIIAFLIGIVVGAMAGSFLAEQSARVAVLSGPYSDNYAPALHSITNARAKLQAGDTNVIEHLNEAEAHVREAQSWARKFLGQRKGAANGSQPIRSVTNSTPSSTGSAR